MLFVHTVRSEWTKLRTTASLWWTTGLFIVFALGLASLMALTVKATNNSDPATGSSGADTAVGNIDLPPDQVVIGIYGIGFMIVLIQAAMVVTSEYRHNYASVTFQATPNRFVVCLAKYVVYAAYTAILTLVFVILSMYFANLFYPDGAIDVWGDDAARRLMWVYPLYAVMLIAFTMGVAMIVRQTAGTIALMLLWYFALENLIKMLPKIGSHIYKYAPFSNLQAFVIQQDIPDLSWGYQGGIWYFLAWAVALFVIGMSLVNKRDA